MSKTPTNLNQFRKRQQKDRAQGKTLCGRGFHKWAFDPKKQFDPQHGKLVSIQRCQRCGTTKLHTQ